MALHRRILGDTLRIGFLTAIAKLAGAGKTIIMARYFGAGDQLDAYLMAFLVPALTGDVLSGSITQSFLPILMEVRASSGRAEAHRLYSSVLAASTAFLTAIAIVTALSSGTLFQWIAIGFPPAKIALTRNLLLLMLPIMPLTAINITWRTLLHAEERFSVAALTPILTPLFSIVFLICFGRDWGIYALAIGTVTGVLVEVVVLGTAAHFAGLRLKPAWSGFSPAARHVFSQYVPLAASNVIMGGSSVVDQMMAAGLAAGSLSALNYGTRVVTVLLATGPTALGVAILPRLSRLAAEKDWFGLRRMIRTYSLLAVAATIPVTAVFMFWSRPIVQTLFERGAFTRADTNLVAAVQIFSMLQIPASVLLILLVMVVSSLKANHLLVRLAIISLITNVVLDFLLMRAYGLPGIALSTAAVHAIGAAYLFRSLSRTKVA